MVALRCYSRRESDTTHVLLMLKPRDRLWQLSATQATGALWGGLKVSVMRPCCDVKLTDLSVSCAWEVRRRKAKSIRMRSQI